MVLEVQIGQAHNEQHRRADVRHGTKQAAEQAMEAITDKGRGVDCEPPEDLG